MSARVEPQWAVVTVLFADLRGFTAFADRATAREAVDHLNAFFAVAVPVVGEHRGEVNKLLGDGLLAVFATPDHPDRALAAATAMLEAVRRRLGDRWRMGVGLNSGLVLRGTIGAAGHREDGVIGDPVNVASRVQSAAGRLGEPLLLTEATHCLLEGPHPELRPRGRLTLRGKARPVAVFALADGAVTVPGRAGRTTVPGCTP